ncbi:MAG: AAA family ATPase [Desulfobacterales bacterium]|nr:AAA family ATPase [Desulfobacterales bacterium]
MNENRENLKAGQARRAQDIEREASGESPKVYSFPSPPDADAEAARATAKKLKIPFVDPLRARIEPAAVALLEPDIAIRRQALPIRLVNDILLVAMTSPGRQIAIRSLEVLTGYKIRPAAAPKSALSTALREVYGRHGRKAIKGGQGALMPGQIAGRREKEHGVRTISVISNKGGVGKTHLAINLAHALADAGAKVLLIDADLGNADISNKLGIFPEHHLMDFLAKDQQMQDLVVPTEYDFDLICGTYGEFKLANLNYAQKVKFISHFKNTSQGYDFAVFDLGAGIARTVLDFALGADRTVIVTTPQDLISGYACAKASFCRFKELEEKIEGRLSDYTPQWTFSPMMVINQVKDLKQGFKLYNMFRKTADENINANEGRFRIDPEYLGSIPYDKESLRIIESKKRPFLADFPHIKASQCIRHMSTRFYNFEDSYESRVRFEHPLKRFAAILSQKI